MGIAETPLRNAIAKRRIYDDTTLYGEGLAGAVQDIEFWAWKGEYGVKTGRRLSGSEGGSKARELWDGQAAS